MSIDDVATKVAERLFNGCKDRWLQLEEFIPETGNHELIASRSFKDAAQEVSRALRECGIKTPNRGVNGEMAIKGFNAAAGKTQAICPTAYCRRAEHSTMFAVYERQDGPAIAFGTTARRAWNNAYRLMIGRQRSVEGVK